jgi:protease I
MAADKNARHAYQDLLATHALASPIKYDELSEKDFDGLILPGGHAKGMKPYLESNLLQSVVGRFFQSNKPVGAICHGVVLASRSKVPSSSLSVLYGRKTTALPQWMELLAWNLTRTWMGDYYRTYPLTVQAEVTATLKSPHDFIRGPFSLKRDSSKHLNVGFIVRDGNYLSGRWPGDSHLFGFEFLKMLTT